MTNKINLLENFVLNIDKNCSEDDKRFASISHNNNKLYATDKQIAIAMDLTEKEINLLNNVHSFLPLSNSPLSTKKNSLLSIENVDYYISSNPHINIKRLFDLQLKADYHTIVEFRSKNLKQLISNALEINDDKIHTKYNKVIQKLSEYTDYEFHVTLLNKEKLLIPNMILIKGQGFYVLLMTLDKIRK